MISWSSYPSSFAIGHKALADLFAGPVTIEEKVDGSQFSMGVFMLDGETAKSAVWPVTSEFRGYVGQTVYLFCRSKGQQINVLAPDKMFTPAVETAKRLAPIMAPGWTYRAEFLGKPKHNALAYDRVPKDHLVGFDIAVGVEDYLASYDEKQAEFARLGLETVPLLYEGVFPVGEEGLQRFRQMLDTVSVLGGQKIEGVVVKNHSRFGLDKKFLVGKFVSEAFKEVHAAEWKVSNPTQGDVVQELIHCYRTPARWAKAIQHLREAGTLEGSPRDIGLLFKEVPKDVLAEAEAEIKQALFAWAWPKVQRGITAGLAEYYKDELLKQQFSEMSPA